MNKQYSWVRLFTFFLPLIIIVLFMMTPFYWAIVTSLKSETAVLSTVAQYLPNPIVFENYLRAWQASKFNIYFLNSLFIASLSVVFIVLLAVLNGYALSRFKFAGKNLFILLLLGTQLIPAVIYIIPLFLVFKSIGLINTPFSLVVFYTVHGIPFNSLLMLGFIGNISQEIDEAALLDGANRFQVIFKLIIPIILPGLVAIAAFAFIGCWNEFLVAFSFITSQQNYTIPIGLRLMIGEFSIDYSGLAAGSIISLIPPVILFAYCQKYLVSGMTAGSVKG